MSRGFGGSARIVWQDENTVVYEYAPFNLNEPEYRNSEHVYDGRITISKDSMVEPEIHEKLKVMHSGKKKLIIKRLRRDVDFGALLYAGKITIENSCYCWHLVGTEKNIGMKAMKIVFRIYDHYQDEGTLSETVSLYY